MKNSKIYSRKISRVLTVKAVLELISSHLKWPTKQNHREVSCWRRPTAFSWEESHFCFYFKKSISEWYFPKNREIGSLVVRSWEKLKNWQNRELGPACGVVADLLIMFNDIARLKKLQKFINFCLKVGHSANLKHSKSTIRQLILLWKLQNHNPAQHFFIGRSSRGRFGTIDLRQLSFWYRVLSCEPTNYESVHTWVIHCQTASSPSSVSQV